ncbi:serine dehydratase alpha chain-domain-containing protein [Xylaria intraflava]|nr:serine dehydratase alpha chain-domain-containing protein [Xylaria intraflava]
MKRAAVQRLGLLPYALRSQCRLPSIVRWRPGINCLVQTQPLRAPLTRIARLNQSRSFSDGGENEQSGTYSEADHEHAVISTFDLFSIGIGPSSSHTVGPMRAGNIFVADLREAGLLDKVHKIRIAIYGSLALTGEGHMTPSALLLGLEGANVATVDTSYVPSRFAEIKKEKKLFLGRDLANGTGKEIDFNYEHDFRWEWGRKLPLHSNGMRFTVFDEEGMMLATNDLFSVGGGFVVNGALSKASNSPAVSSTTETDQPESKGLEVDTIRGSPIDLAENMFYKEIRRENAAGDRRTGPEIKPVARIEASNSVGGSVDITQSGSDKEIIRGDEAGDRQTGSEVKSTTETVTQNPRYPFHDGQSLLALCNKHNLTIAQLVYENEKSNGYTDEEIHKKLFRIWDVMDQSILEGVRAPVASILPGSLKLQRRAPSLYNKLTRGLYPSNQNGTNLSSQAQLSSTTLIEENSVPTSGAPLSIDKAKVMVGSQVKKGVTSKRAPRRVHGSVYHPIMPSPHRRTTFAAMDYLTVYAIAVNETNAGGGRIVTAPTNGAAGIIPAVLKYTTEFISDDPERDILTFLLTAAAIGMLYKRGATISAAEGGCMAEVGVACSMAAGAFAACMGASPETVEQAAEIGIEHNLGLTCDPIGGLVQAPCIERNALGAIKAISSANLALSSETGTQKVSLDDAIRAMRVTAQGMRNEFKETSLSGLATSVPLNIPVSVPDC